MIHVVLIILAGVSITVLTGDSGVIYQASKAKLETRNCINMEDKLHR